MAVAPHMTQSTRTLLAKFFKVHPGFLVDDPVGYHTELVSDLRTTEGKLDLWLLQGSERFASDPAVSAVASKRLKEMLAFTELVERWYTQMLNVPRPRLMTLIKLGEKIVSFLPAGKSK